MNSTDYTNPDQLIDHNGANQMIEPHLTLPPSNTELQKIRYIDIYDMNKPCQFEDSQENDWHATEPREALTPNGHGSGIRIYYDHALTGEKARRMLLWYAGTLDEERIAPNTSVTLEQISSRANGTPSGIADLLVEEFGVGAFKRIKSEFEHAYEKPPF